MLGSKHWAPPAEGVASDFYEFSSAYDAAFFEAISHQEMISTTALTEMIISARDKKEARSFLRIGDGEGNILDKLSGLEVGPELKKYCLELISYIHFGDRKIVPDAEPVFTDLLTDALKAADIIGVVGHGSIRAGFNRPDQDKDVRGIVGQRVSMALTKKHSKFADIWFNRGLLPHYPAILGGQDVTIISSYENLGDVLSKNMKLKSASLISVPAQAVFSKPSDRKNTKHYPEGMMKIVDAIAPKSGQIFLIGAGLLGKHYAKIVKDRGGIALDIGSVPEIWLGIPSRGLSQEYIDKWKLV